MTNSRIFCYTVVLLGGLVFVSNMLSLLNSQRYSIGTHMTTCQRLENKRMLANHSHVYHKRNISTVCKGMYTRLLTENKIANARKQFSLGSPPPHDFKFIINNENICSSVHELLYFIYVYSVPHHFIERKRIRSMWGNVTAVNGSPGRVAFIIGLSDSRDVQKNVEQESSTYKDIIQINMVDSYANLTIKGAMSNLWVTLYCNNAQFLVKADEDTLVNVFKLTKYLKENAIGYKRTLFCWVQNGELVMRGGKFWVSMSQLPAYRYPRFCHGPLWVATPDLPEELFCASFKVPYIPCEDAYTSGLLVDYIGKIKHVSAPGIDTWPSNVRKQYFTDEGRPVPIASVPDPSIYKWAWEITLEKLSGEEKTLLNEEYLKYYKTL